MTSKKRKPPVRRLPSREDRKSEVPKDLTAEIEDTVAKIEELRGQASSISDQVQVLQENALFMLEESGLDNVKFERDGNSISATVVRSQSTTTDYEKFKRLIGSTMWTKITTRTLDKKKLEAYLKSGEIKTTTLAAASDVTDRAPFIKITKKSK